MIVEGAFREISKKKSSQGVGVACTSSPFSLQWCGGGVGGVEVVGLFF